MKWFLTVIAALLFGVVLAEDFPVIVPYSHQRIWQVVAKPSDPLRWRWEDQATSASLTISNVLTGTVEGPLYYSRSDDEIYGSRPMPAPVRSADTGEGLIDLTLVQYAAGSTEIETQKARLAFLPGIGGASIDVQKKDESFCKIGSPRVVSYDTAWSSVPVSTVTCSIKSVVGQEIEIPIPGTSGYFGLAPVSGVLTLYFDASVAYSAKLTRRAGSITIFR